MKLIALVGILLLFSYISYILLKMSFYDRAVLKTVGTYIFIVLDR